MIAGLGKEEQFAAPELCRDAVAQSAFQYRRHSWLPARNGALASSGISSFPSALSTEASTPGAGLPFELPLLMRSPNQGAAVPV